MRQVDPSDTELSVGDDDGFLAVVMANRLPQFHRSTGPADPDRPVRYLACLVNLEQQLGVLPTPPPPGHTFEVTDQVSVFNLAGLAVTTDPDRYVMGAGGLAATVRTGPIPDPAHRAAAGTGAAAAPARPIHTTATSTTASAASWQTAPAKVAEVAVSAAAEEAGRLVRDTMGINFRYDVERLVTFEPMYRFPVLAHWSFTAVEGGTFETYLQGLDVGLLGTAPPAPPSPPPGTPPATEPIRPPAELADTGHLGLAHQTRRGDLARAWYRGPLTPRPAGVDPNHPEGRLPLAHTSDQLRRVTPDGREDLSLAAAFEIGRLLALSQPSVVSAQLRWRREQFGAARADLFARSAVTGLAEFGLSFTGADRASDLGRLLGRRSPCPRPPTRRPSWPRPARWPTPAGGSSWTATSTRWWRPGSAFRSRPSRRPARESDCSRHCGRPTYRWWRTTGEFRRGRRRPAAPGVDGRGGALFADAAGRGRTRRCPPPAPPPGRISRRSRPPGRRVRWSRPPGRGCAGPGRPGRRRTGRLDPGGSRGGGPPRSRRDRQRDREGTTVRVEAVTGGPGRRDDPGGGHRGDPGPGRSGRRVR